MVELTEEQIRKFMELSVEVMKNSIQEKRHDEKPSPFVGAVMVREDMSVVTAYRGELREVITLNLLCWRENVGRKMLKGMCSSPHWSHAPPVHVISRSWVVPNAL